MSKQDLEDLKILMRRAYKAKGLEINEEFLDMVVTTISQETPDFSELMQDLRDYPITDEQLLKATF